MGKAKWTHEVLDKNTVAQLREMCKLFGIPGMSKKRKDIVIEAIIAKKSRKRTTSSSTISKKTASGEPTKVTAVEFNSKSVLTKENASSGRIETKVSVACGASSGDYPVAGKTVGAVAEFLREVLNIPSTPSMLVNGESVSSSTILKAKDSVEFMKPSGRKGI